MCAPSCCGALARLTDGREVFPLRPDLARKPVWLCDTCKGYVGCHAGGHAPMGIPGTAPVRAARQAVHRAFDPIWKTAWQHHAYAGRPKKARGGIRKRARERAYAYLAHRLGIPLDECHAAMFDADRCAAALAVLDGLTYGTVREWARAQEAAARAASRPDTGRAAA
jgi:hypothetical protein